MGERNTSPVSPTSSRNQRYVRTATTFRYKDPKDLAATAFSRTAVKTADQEHLYRDIDIRSRPYTHDSIQKREVRSTNAFEGRSGQVSMFAAFVLPTNSPERLGALVSSISMLQSRQTTEQPNVYQQLEHLKSHLKGADNNKLPILSTIPIKGEHDRGRSVSPTRRNKKHRKKVSSPSEHAKGPRKRSKNRKKKSKSESQKDPSVKLPILKLVNALEKSNEGLWITSASEKTSHADELRSCNQQSIEFVGNNDFDSIKKTDNSDFVQQHQLLHKRRAYDVIQPPSFLIEHETVQDNRAKKTKIQSEGEKVRKVRDFDKHSVYDGNYFQRLAGFLRDSNDFSYSANDHGNGLENSMTIIDYQSNETMRCIPTMTSKDTHTSPVFIQPSDECVIHEESAPRTSNISDYDKFVDSYKPSTLLSSLDEIDSNAHFMDMKCMKEKIDLNYDGENDDNSYYSDQIDQTSSSPPETHNELGSHSGCSDLEVTDDVRTVENVANDAIEHTLISMGERDCDVLEVENLEEHSWNNNFVSSVSSIDDTDADDENSWQSEEDFSNYWHPIISQYDPPNYTDSMPVSSSSSLYFISETHSYNGSEVFRPLLDQDASMYSFPTLSVTLLSDVEEDTLMSDGDNSYTYMSETSSEVVLPDDTEVCTLEQYGLRSPLTRNLDAESTISLLDGPEDDHNDEASDIDVVEFEHEKILDAMNTAVCTNMILDTVILQEIEEIATTLGHVSQFLDDAIEFCEHEAQKPFDIENPEIIDIYEDEIEEDFLTEQIGLTLLIDFVESETALLVDDTLQSRHFFAAQPWSKLALYLINAATKSTTKRLSKKKCMNPAEFIPGILIDTIVYSKNNFPSMGNGEYGWCWFSSRMCDDEGTKPVFVNKTFNPIKYFERTISTYTESRKGKRGNGLSSSSSTTTTTNESNYECMKDSRVLVAVHFRLSPDGTRHEKLLTEQELFDYLSFSSSTSAESRKSSVSADHVIDLRDGDVIQPLVSGALGELKRHDDNTVRVRYRLLTQTNRKEIVLTKAPSNQHDIQKLPVDKLKGHLDMFVSALESASEQCVRELTAEYYIDGKGRLWLIELHTMRDDYKVPDLILADVDNVICKTLSTLQNITENCVEKQRIHALSISLHEKGDYFPSLSWSELSMNLVHHASSNLASHLSSRLKGQVALATYVESMHNPAMFIPGILPNTLVYSLDKKGKGKWIWFTGKLSKQRISQSADKNSFTTSPALVTKVFSRSKYIEKVLDMASSNPGTEDNGNITPVAIRYRIIDGETASTNLTVMELSAILNPTFFFFDRKDGDMIQPYFPLSSSKTVVGNSQTRHSVVADSIDTFGVRLIMKYQFLTSTNQKKISISCSNDEVGNAVGKRQEEYLRIHMHRFVGALEASSLQCVRDLAAEYVVGSNGTLWLLHVDTIREKYTVPSIIMEDIAGCIDNALATVADINGRVGSDNLYVVNTSWGEIVDLLLVCAESDDNHVIPPIPGPIPDSIIYRPVKLGKWSWFSSKMELASSGSNDNDDSGSRMGLHRFVLKKYNKSKYIEKLLDISLSKNIEKSIDNHYTRLNVRSNIIAVRLREHEGILDEKVLTATELTTLMNSYQSEDNSKLDGDIIQPFLTSSSTFTDPVSSKDHIKSQNEGVLVVHYFVTFDDYLSKRNFSFEWSLSPEFDSSSREFDIPQEVIELRRFQSTQEESLRMMIQNFIEAIEPLLSRPSQKRVVRHLTVTYVLEHQLDWKLWLRDMSISNSAFMAASVGANSLEEQTERSVSSPIPLVKIESTACESPVLEISKAFVASTSEVKDSLIAIKDKSSFCDIDEDSVLNYKAIAFTKENEMKQGSEGEIIMMGARESEKKGEGEECNDVMTNDKREHFSIIHAFVQDMDLDIDVNFNIEDEEEGYTEEESLTIKSQPTSSPSPSSLDTKQPSIISGEDSNGNIFSDAPIIQNVNTRRVLSHMKNRSEMPREISARTIDLPSFNVRDDGSFAITTDDVGDPDETKELIERTNKERIDEENTECVLSTRLHNQVEQNRNYNSVATRHPPSLDSGSKISSPSDAVKKESKQLSSMETKEQSSKLNEQLKPTGLNVPQECGNDIAESAEVINSHKKEKLEKILTELIQSAVEEALKEIPRTKQLNKAVDDLPERGHSITNEKIHNESSKMFNSDVTHEEGDVKVCNSVKVTAVGYAATVNKQPKIISDDEVVEGKCEDRVNMNQVSIESREYTPLTMHLVEIEDLDIEARQHVLYISDDLVNAEYEDACGTCGDLHVKEYAKDVIRESLNQTPTGQVSEGEIVEGQDKMLEDLVHLECIDEKRGSSTTAVHPMSPTIVLEGVHNPDSDDQIAIVNVKNSSEIVYHNLLLNEMSRLRAELKEIKIGYDESKKVLKDIFDTKERITSDILRAGFSIDTECINELKCSDLDGKYVEMLKSYKNVNQEATLKSKDLEAKKKTFESKQVELKNVKVEVAITMKAISQSGDKEANQGQVLKEKPLGISDAKSCNDRDVNVQANAAAVILHFLVNKGVYSFSLFREGKVKRDSGSDENARNQSKRQKRGYRAPYRWFWENDDKTLTAYDDNLNEAIEFHYDDYLFGTSDVKKQPKESPSESCPSPYLLPVVQVCSTIVLDNGGTEKNTISYCIDFQNETQINESTGFVRKISRKQESFLDDDARKATVTDIQFNSAWYYMDDKRTWNRYDRQSEIQIHAAYAHYCGSTGRSRFRLEGTGNKNIYSYEINFALGTQLNVETNTRRRIDKRVRIHTESKSLIQISSDTVGKINESIHFGGISNTDSMHTYSRININRAVSSMLEMKKTGTISTNGTDSANNDRIKDLKSSLKVIKAEYEALKIELEEGNKTKNQLKSELFEWMEEFSVKHGRTPRKVERDELAPQLVGKYKAIQQLNQQKQRQVVDMKNHWDSIRDQLQALNRSDGSGNSAVLSK